jgi:phospholipid/cholesterol/gamma-HCH transport system permease protein
MAEYLRIIDDTASATDDWVLQNATSIDRKIREAVKNNRFTTIHAEIGHLDMAGATLLQDLAQQHQLSGLSAPQQALMDLVNRSDHEDIRPPLPCGLIRQALVGLGCHALEVRDNLLDLVRFIGETTITLFHVALHPSKLRLSSVTRHIRETGLAAVPIVALIAFLISVVLAYQGANQLRRFGAEIFTINMVAVSVLREMGVLLTAIMIAGRSGSAFTAEIGVMKVNEEVDAMRIIGVNPFEILVVPRVIALVITLPLLAFVADLMGLAGGGLISYSLLQVSHDQYLDRFRDAVSMSDFWVGMIKAPVFAFFIAIVSCMRGMQVSGSAESVGRLTTISVVQSIFLVLLLDALFSILFTRLGI